MFYNQSGYHAHLFIRELGKSSTKIILQSLHVKTIFKLVGINSNESNELRKSIQLMFIESCKFMSFSLDKLASNLHLDQCKYLKKSYEGDRAVNVLTQKGVYPCEYMDSGKKFEGSLQ